MGIITLGLRGVQALFALIVLALSGAAVTTIRHLGANNDESNFLVFNGVWSLFLVIPFLVLAPAYLSISALSYITIAVEAVTMIFWFAGFIAEAAFVGTLNPCNARFCHELQAATVFAAFEWVLFTATLVLTVIPIIRNRGSNPNKGPATAEVHAGA